MAKDRGSGDAEHSLAIRAGAALLKRGLNSGREMLGHFFDRDGGHVDTPLTARTVAVSLRKESDDQIVALAGGPEKIEPLRAVLRSSRLSGLITDERSAAALVDDAVANPG